MMQGWRDVKRVVVARLDNVGDVLMLSPSLRAIKENLPQARLTLWASPAGSTAAPLLSEVDDVLSWRVVWQDVGGKMEFDPARERRLIAELRKGRFAAAIIFTSLSQSPFGVGYACYLAGIPLRLGQSKEFGGSLLSTVVPPLADATHQVERSLHLLRSSGLVVQTNDIRLRVPNGVRTQVAAKLEAHGLGPDARYALIHPAASCPARAYPAARYGRVADQIIKKLGLAVVLTGAERDRATVDRVTTQMTQRPVVLAGATTVGEWAALIEQAAVVVTNNTGALHVADAFRRPNVILYSGTDLTSQWRPRHSPNKVLQRAVPCSPCYGFTCPYDLDCLDITPDEVVAAVAELVDQRIVALETRRAEEV